MSMIYSALAIDAATLKQLRQDEELVLGVTRLSSKRFLDQVLERQMEMMPEAQRIAARKRREEAEAYAAQRMPERFAAEIAKTKALQERAAALSIGPAMSIGKSWDAFHHLFELAGGSLFEGQPLGPDQGYGPASLRSRENVASFSQFLDSAGHDQVRQADMRWLREQNIYAWPSVDDTSVSDNELREDLNAHFQVLREYVQSATQRGDAMLTWVS